MTDSEPGDRTAGKQNIPQDVRPNAATTPTGSGTSAKEPRRSGTMPSRLREKGATASEKVQSRVTHARDVASEKAPVVKETLRDKRAAATEKVQAGVTHARDVASEKAPVVKDVVQQRRGLVGGVVGTVAAVLVYLLLRRGRRRKR